VLSALASERVDAYLCAGDLVGYGPHPNECVEAVMELGAACVAGNHDLIATGRLVHEGIGDLARRTLEWTAGVLDPSVRDHLAQLPLELVSHDVRLTHGALGDPRLKIRTGAQAAGQLEAMAAQHPAQRILVLGHTHVPFAYAERRGPLPAGRSATLLVPASERHLLNPGGTGQSRERRVLAHGIVLDLDERRATFLAVPYDFAACDRDLRRAGLPQRTYHLKPTPLHRRARRYARRLFRAPR
jgi:predicted phosphodiesterase